MEVSVASVKAAAAGAIEKVLGKFNYQPGAVRQWTAEILSETCDALPNANKDGSVKFVVSCSILQTLGAGFYANSTGYWDGATDGSETVNWKDKFESMICTVTVWWVKSMIKCVIPPAEYAYPENEVKEICLRHADAVIGSETNYEQSACKIWAADILSKAVTDIAALGRPFKYVVGCQLLQLAPVGAQEWGPYGEWDNTTSKANEDDGDETAGDEGKPAAAGSSMPAEGPFGTIGKAGAGFHTACSAIWDEASDGSTTLSWKSFVTDANAGPAMSTYRPQRGVRCIITAHGLFDEMAGSRPS
jgi:dynein light chain Tctex-type 1